MIELFNGLVKIDGIVFFLFIIAIVIALGYLLGRITIKGVCLGTAGVFIVALIVGAVFKDSIVSIKVFEAGDYDSAFKTMENLGLVFFVTSVGLIAGPNFFVNLKKYFKSYILLGLIIIILGGLTCAACYFIGSSSEPDHDYFIAMLVGIMSGALTSTPAFSASKATAVATFAADGGARQEVIENAVTAGHGIAYIFGVVGVVLFVQLVPKLLRANMDEERNKVAAIESNNKRDVRKDLIKIDNYGLFVFGISIIIGVFIGAIRIPLTSKGFSGTCFNLTTTGGALLTSLVLGHFGHIGRVSLEVNKKVLEVFRELGLMMFLIGAGIPGGVNFVANFKSVYFVYGIFMTLVPMIVGFIFAKYILKIPLFNNLGSITGGMTSTPALGTLINVTKSDDVASAYAATYPIALVAVVLVSQFLILVL